MSRRIRNKRRGPAGARTTPPPSTEPSLRQIATQLQTLQHNLANLQTDVSAIVRTVCSNGAATEPITPMPSEVLGDPGVVLGDGIYPEGNPLFPSASASGNGDDAGDEVDDDTVDETDDKSSGDSGDSSDTDDTDDSDDSDDSNTSNDDNEASLSEADVSGDVA